MKKIVILGAGISGLSLGWYLTKRFGKNLDLKILESSERPGGWIQSEEKEGFFFEKGPRSIRPKGPGLDTVELIEELGLQNEVIAPDLSSKKRYFLKEGTLRLVPPNLFSFLMSPYFSLDFVKEWKRPKQSFEDESIASFFTRRFNHKIAEELIDPMTKGIFGGDMHKLSLKCCFPLFHEWEQKHGSLLKGAFFHSKRKPATDFAKKMNRLPMISFKKGLQTLTDTLAEHLPVHYKSAITTLPEADHIFLCIPARSAAHYFTGETHSLLSNLPKEELDVVQLGYKKDLLAKKGFGYLIPSMERESVLGIVFDSCVFPRESNESRLTVLLKSSEPQDKALEAVSRHLKINAKPDFINVFKATIPQYFIGHHKIMERVKNLIADSHPNVTLAGNSYSGISINDCIVQSKSLAGWL